MVIARDIRVLVCAVLGSKTSTATLASTIRASVLSSSVLPGVCSTLSTIDLSCIGGTNGRLEGCVVSCSVTSHYFLEGMIIFLISEGGFTSSITTQC